METAEGLSELGRAALSYVGRGFALIPLRPREKVPMTAHGLRDWTDDPASVAEIWRRYPDANIGIVCGAPSGGLVVLDLDRHGDGPDGQDARRAWERANGDLPETCCAVTGSGGYHMLYRVPGGAEVRPSVNRELAVDVRGDGSYIVAPPSVHPSGARYEWETPPEEVPPAEATPAVLAFVESVRPAGSASGGGAARMELPGRVGEGGRNDALYRLGCSLRAKRVEPDVIADTMRGVNASRFDPPLPADEVERCVRSVLALREGRSGGFGAAATDAAPGGGAAGEPGEAPGWRGGRPGGRIQFNVLGRHLIEECRARVIDGAPAVWTGRRWEFGKRAITRQVLLAEDAATSQVRNEVYAYVMDMAPRVSSDLEFDGGHYVSFRNCTWDAVGMRRVEPTPEMFISGTLPLDLDEGADTSAADAYVGAWAAGDPDTALAMFEVMGACMDSRRAVNQAPMLIGRAGGARGGASNGKSTYLNWMRSILGTENVSSLDIATLGQRFNAGRLTGMLANLGDDIPDGFLRGDELSVFKKLVTGDAVFTDVKNGDGYEFRPATTLVFSMNAVPRLSDTTEGVFRRLAFVPFRARFEPGAPGYDGALAAKLARPEVMRGAALSALCALPALVERGTVTAAPDMADEVEEVRRDNNSVMRWVDDEGLGLSAFDGVAMRESYARYRAWCDDSGERSPFSMRMFGSKVREIDLTEDRRGADFGKVFRVLTEVKWQTTSGKTAKTFVKTITEG